MTWDTLLWRYLAYPVSADESHEINTKNLCDVVPVFVLLMFPSARRKKTEKFSRGDKLVEM